MPPNAMTAPMRGSGRESVPHPRRQDRVQVPHGPLHPRAALREDLDVAVPDDRGPGKAWMIRPAADDAPIRVEGAVPIRIGYSRCSTATQELASQLEALKDARC